MMGDWVIVRRPSSRREKVRVKSVIGNGTIEAKTRDGLVALGELVVEPIPLTAEILEKNGFEELMSEGWESAAKFGRVPEPTGVWQYGFGQFDSVSYLPKRNFLSVKFMEGYTADIANIKYVHELQHALRLCGVGKEIIL